MSGSPPGSSIGSSKSPWEAYDRLVGLDLGDITVDGCIVKAPCGGEAAGRSPVDRGKQGTKRSLLVEAAGIPIGCVVAGAPPHDPPLLRPPLGKPGRLHPGRGIAPPPRHHRPSRRRVS